ncbi:hypothetical protein [Neptunomonas japonica]|uniref:hypothetical protein n=1 Tax=Neptunomonas japonica TaxID=417574 RepID=UPI00042A3A7F|nr:hypothetical protein [Neptunomonas japonica]
MILKQSSVLQLPFSDDEPLLSLILEMDEITTFFQLIFDLHNGDLIGHEVLSEVLKVL